MSSDHRRQSLHSALLLLLVTTAVSANAGYPVGYLHGFPWCRCNTTSPQPIRMDFLGSSSAPKGGMTTLSFKLSTSGDAKPFNLAKIYLPMSELDGKPCTDAYLPRMYASHACSVDPMHIKFLQFVRLNPYGSDRC